MNRHHSFARFGQRAQSNIRAHGRLLVRFSLFITILCLACLVASNRIQPLFAQATAEPTTPSTYVVKRGETLSQIAEKFNVSLNTLMFYNGISNPNDIYVGQTLQLPPPATPTPADSYTVKAGETLSQIAEANHVDLAELMALNGITDPNAIYRGQVLRLPSTQTTTNTPTPTTTDTAATDITATSTAPTSASATQATATRTPTVTPTPTPATTYTVRSGETLSQIAEANHVDLSTLMRINGIQNPNAIYVGQVLYLTIEAALGTTVPTPSPTASNTATAQDTPTATSTGTTTQEDTATPEASETVSSTATVTNSAEVDTNATPTGPETATLPIATLNQVYTVQPGDTLQRIALRLGVEQEAMRKLNHLTTQQMNWLTVGTTVTVPATGDQLRFVRHEEQRYVVKAGDSLGRIAEKYDLSLTEMLLANRIANPNAIYPGQSLLIPDKKQSDDANDKAKDKAQIGPERNGFFYYTVQSGDTISTLAERFDSTRQAILDYNNLPDEKTVYLGLELRIPFGPPLLPVDLPPVPASGTKFMVSLSRQQCWVFEGSRVAHTWPCSTGYGEWKTRTGAFAVQSKFDVAKSQAYQLDMPFWLGIYNVGTYENGIHGLPIRWSTGKKIWTHLIGEPATYGCAMLDDDNAAELYKLAYIGMPVYIVN
ncbi:MAG: LysM peptidoglycan-binding domain-containing protein [Caldilineaceae bacterium]